MYTVPFFPKCAEIERRYDPAVLSGRAGRRYIRWLLSDANAIPHLESGEIDLLLRRVRGLLSENTSRLCKYSGAERVGVMLDRARLHLLEAGVAGAAGDRTSHKKHLIASRALTDAAKRRAFSGSVSYAGKLDVLAVQSEANLRYVEAALDGLIEGPDELKEALTWAGIAAHDLWRMADYLEAEPARGLGAWLEAEALIVEHRMIKAGYDFKSRTGRPLDKASAKLRAARATMERIGDATLARRIPRTLAALQEELAGD
ncbi:MAG TPA: hypothetical protein VF548_17960 [Allosphingosinicella sp.]|jgi:hypothetical protein